MEGLIVLTLFVVPATGACVAVTEPDSPVLPESGT
jgi:hypothetical protein